MKVDLLQEMKLFFCHERAVASCICSQGIMHGDMHAALMRASDSGKSELLSCRRRDEDMCFLRYELLCALSVCVMPRLVDYGLHWLEIFLPPINKMISFVTK
jgi:hypothetical protein